MPMRTVAALATRGAGLTAVAKWQVGIGVKLGTGQWAGKGLPEDDSNGTRISWDLMMPQRPTRARAQRGRAGRRCAESGLTSS